MVTKRKHAEMSEFKVQTPKTKNRNKSFNLHFLHSPLYKSGIVI